MSKFFKALEQAERDRLLRQQGGRPEAEVEVGKAPAAATEASSARAVAVAPADPTSSPFPGEGRGGGPTEDTPPTAAVATESPTRPERARSRWPAGPGRMMEPEVGPVAYQPPIPVSPAPAPDSTGVDERLVSLLRPAEFEAEQYRALRHAVELAHKRSGLSVLAISSPTVGDGKTTTAINLAGALAQASEARVLLVDADLRRPSMESRLGLVGGTGPGLAHLILDPVLALDDVIRTLVPFNLSVIPAGPVGASSYEIFKSPRLGEVLEQARRRFDHIVVDVPPLAHVLDSRVLARWVDGYLLVVACDRTPRKLLEEALNVMEPEKVLGLVFNGDVWPVSDSYYQYSYGPARHGWGAGWVAQLRHSFGGRRAPR